MTLGYDPGDYGDDSGDYIPESKRVADEPLLATRLENILRMWLDIATSIRMGDNATALEVAYELEEETNDIRTRLEVACAQETVTEPVPQR